VKQQKHKKILYFTSSFPYGLGEEWKLNDLDVLKKYFEQVDVIPLSYGGNREIRSELPDDIIFHEPLFEASADVLVGASKIRFLLALLIDPQLRLESSNGYNFKSLRSLRRLRSSYQSGVKIAQRLIERNILNSLDGETYLFFFWGLGTADSIPWIPDKYRNIVVGYHGFDLYEERHYGDVFPFRQQQLARMKLAVSCSMQGANYLKQRYPEFKNKITNRCLGVRDCGIGNKSNDGQFRIVSCSFVRMVKRLNLLVDGLSQCNSNVVWTHIGGGEGLEELKGYASRKLTRDNISFDFLGNISPSEVRNYFKENSVDALINTSSYEGLPVSMMEALSAGIPLIGTNVGGVSEIIDKNVGVLLSKNPSEFEISEVIDYMASMSVLDAKSLRINARSKFINCFQVPGVIEEFVEKMLES
jgi:colanic acid/amylovoran biosynthesis glycosyltransferase